MSEKVIERILAIADKSGYVSFVQINRIICDFIGDDAKVKLTPLENALISATLTVIPVKKFRRSVSNNMFDMTIKAEDFATVLRQVTMFMEARQMNLIYASNRPEVPIPSAPSNPPPTFNEASSSSPATSSSPPAINVETPTADTTDAIEEIIADAPSSDEPPAIDDIIADALSSGEPTDVDADAIEAIVSEALSSESPAIHSQSLLADSIVSDGDAHESPSTQHNDGCESLLADSIVSDGDAHESPSTQHNDGCESPTDDVQSARDVPDIDVSESLSAEHNGDKPADGILA